MKSKFSPQIIHIILVKMDKKKKQKLNAPSKRAYHNYWWHVKEQTWTIDSYSEGIQSLSTGHDDSQKQCENECE